MEDYTLSWLTQVKFWILLILSIPSAICSLLILLYFYRRRHTISLNHHLIIVLIVMSFLQITIDIPFVMDYYHRGTVAFSSDSFCKWWNWWEYSFNTLLIVVMAWGSVERYLLVFHRSIMVTKRQRLLFHYLPLSIACLYPPLFYLHAIVLNTCQTRWDYNIVLCLTPCYELDQPALSSFDFISNMACTVFIIAIANIGLVLRVVWHKRNIRTGWRRERKLTRQLVFIAVLYMISWAPLTVTGLILTFITSDVLLDLQVHIFFTVIYLVPLLLPFISVNFLNDFRKTVIKRPMATVGLPARR